MRAAIVIITLISAAAIAGCGSNPQSVHVTPTPGPRAVSATTEAKAETERLMQESIRATVAAIVPTPESASSIQTKVAEALATIQSTRTAESQQTPSQAARGAIPPTRERSPPPTPDIVKIALDRGIRLAEDGYYSAALKELERAQRLHRGRSEEAEIWLSKVQEALGNPEAALKHQENALALRESASQPLATPVPTAALETTVAAGQTEPAPTPLPTTRPTPTNTPTPAPTTEPTRTPAPTPTIPVIQTEAPTSTPPPIISRAPARGADSRLTKLTDIQNARWLSQNRPEIAENMASLPWATDGLSETEEKIIEQLLFLYVKNNTHAAVSLMDMPFLQSVNPGDLQAVTSLRMISQKGGPTAFQQIMNHPTFSAVGITDAWTPVVATLESVQNYNQGLIPALLDQTQVYVETKNIQTPLGGAAALNIVRIGAASDPQSIDRLENAARGAENFMGEPFPTDMVSVLYADAVRGNYAGHNSGNSIVILPKYDSGTEKSSQGINDHEVAHYYWRGNENWIDEGMAEFMTAAYRARLAGTRILPDNPPCPDFRTISKLSTRDDTHRCDYSLGERLFIDLHDAVGTTEFRKEMAALYRESTVEDNADSLTGTKLGISHIKAKFTSAAAKEVIDRWYHGSEPYRTDLYDRDPVDPKMSVLNAQVNRTGLFINSNPVNSFSSSRNGSGAVLSIGYSHTNPVATPGEIAFQFVVFYQDGHPFLVHERTVTASIGSTGFNGIGTYVWSPGQPKPAPGEYVGYVYEAGKKVAQVHWSVTP